MTSLLKPVLKEDDSDSFTGHKNCIAYMRSGNMAPWKGGRDGF